MKRESGVLGSFSGRLRVCVVVLVLLTGVVVVRLFWLQVLRHGYYASLADSQHETSRTITAKRGTIYFTDGKTKSLIPVATTQERAFVFADPREIVDAEGTARVLVDILDFPFEDALQTKSIAARPELVEGSPQVTDAVVHVVGSELDAIADIPAPEEVAEEEETPLEALVRRLGNNKDPYEPILHGVPEEDLTALRERNLPGIQFVREPWRAYLESQVGGHVIGFVGKDEEGSPVGLYGIEGYYNSTLSGVDGYESLSQDVSGRLIPVGDREYTPAQDGADIVLTIDRTIQFMACKLLREAVLSYDAEGGSVVVMDPKTGDVLAMCGYPDFEPAKYNEAEGVWVYNNPATFGAYEPGSIFKPVTMAAGLDVDAVSPSSTYEDTGVIEVPPFQIKNSDKKAHGVVTMTKVLEESLNTGAAHVMELVGKDVFKQYVEAFGFGKKTQVPLMTERAGDISSLEKDGIIYALTASFGQGITATPIQMAQAYGAMANGGVLMQPRVISEIRYPDGVVERVESQQVRRVISEKTSRLLGAMLVSVVENGHGKRAGVKGYYIAGKTGTAQVARGGKYVEGETIGSFAGFGPVEDPRFVMVTRIDIPKRVQFAESTAAPLFGKLAGFLLEYLDVAPRRDL